MQFDIQSLEAKFARFMFRVNGSTRMGLWEKLATLIGTGVPILQALDSILIFRKKMFGRSDPVCLAIEDWMISLRSGLRFSDATEGWINDSERILLAAGEESGHLDGSLRSAVTLLEAGSDIRDAIIGGLAYPAFLSLIAFGVMYLFGFKIIPSFSQTVGADKWTGMAAAMVVASGFIRDWLWLLAVLIVASIAIFFASLPHWNGRYRTVLDRYPPYAIYRIVQGSTWLIAFSAMVEAGIKTEKSLEQMSQNSNRWMKARMQACLGGMRNGENVGQALANSGYGFPDPEIIGDLEVYSRLKGFNEALSILGSRWLKEGVKRIQSRMKVVFGVCLLLVASIVAFMVGGMIAMQLQMSQILQQSLH